MSGSADSATVNVPPCLTCAASAASPKTSCPAADCAPDRAYTQDYPGEEYLDDEYAEDGYSDDAYDEAYYEQDTDESGDYDRGYQDRFYDYDELGYEPFEIWATGKRLIAD